MSFQISINPSRRAAGRYISKVRRALQRAVVEEREKKGMTQSDIARAINVHRSVISRELNGRSDITLGRVGEIAWALGRDISFDLVEREELAGENFPQIAAGANSTWMVHAADSEPEGNTVILAGQGWETKQKVSAS